MQTTETEEDETDDAPETGEAAERDIYTYGTKVNPLTRDEVISPDVPQVAVSEVDFAGETEALLKGIISECHLMMRQVALPSMCASHDSQTRRDFMDTAMGLARTAAGVAETIGRLRDGAELPIEPPPRRRARKKAKGA